MVNEKIKNIKIAVHSKEQSKWVQEKLFRLGAKWRTQDNIVKNLDGKYLFVSEDGRITYCDDDKKFFDKHTYHEIYVEDFLRMQVETPLLDILNSAQGIWLDTALEEELVKTKQSILKDITKFLLDVRYSYGEPLDYRDELKKYEEILNDKLGINK